MEHKYQWSLFIDPSKSEQFVIRCDDPTEFLAGIELVRELLRQRPATDAEPEVPIDQCQIHNALMKERQNKNGGHWYDHRWQENGVWHVCNGQKVKVIPQPVSPLG